MIGCGSVSGQYLPVLTKCPYVEVVSVCDIKPERAKKRAEQFNVPHWYPHIDKLLAGEPFDFMITLTDMQEHEHLNRQALEAGKHVWSEKPIANTLAAGQELLKLAPRKKSAALGRANYRAKPAVRLYGQDGRTSGKTRARRRGPCGLWARRAGLVRLLL